MKSGFELKLLMLLSLVVALILAQACSEEDAISPKNILIENDWKITEFKADFSVSLLGIPLPTEQSFDLIEELDECLRDDLLDFLEDNSFVVKPNLILCDEEDNYEDTGGEWAISEDESLFSVYYDNFDFELEDLDDDFEINLEDMIIEELSSSTFKLRKTENIEITNNGVAVSTKVEVLLTLESE